MVTFYSNTLHSREGQLNEVQGELQSALQRKLFVWVDVQAGVTDWSSCEALLEALGVSLLAEGSERIELAADHIAGVLKELAIIDGVTAPPLHFFYFPYALFTLHHQPSSAVQGAVQAGRALGGKWQSDTLLALLLTSAFAPLELPVQQALAESEALEALVLALSERDEGDLLLRLSTAQTRVARLKAFVVAKRELIGELSDAKRTLGPALHTFLRHLKVHKKHHLGALTIAANRLADHGSTYLGKVQLNVAQANDETNGVMKVLTVLSTITLPLLFGQGLFSMNLDLPGRNVPNLHWWFAIIAVCTAAIIAALIALKRISWL